MWYTTTDESTEITRVMRLDLFRSLPFHLDNLAATLAVSFCSSSLHNLPRDRGSPRYLHGNDTSAAWNFPISFCSSSLRNLPRDRGNPRYLHGNDASAA
jgi:hypothetical protein